MSARNSNANFQPIDRVSRRHFLCGSMTVLAAGLSAAPLHSRSPFSESPPETEPQSWRERLDSSGGLDDAYWEKVRQEFNIVDGITYMNNGTMGPVPRSVVEAQTRYLIDIAADPRIGGWNRVEPVREKLARFVGANADEIVLTRSTTEGMKIFSRGLDLGRGDEVLMSSHEHPGGYGPWRAREDRDGIIVRTVDIPAPPNSVDEVIDICERALRPETRVLVVSYPIFVTGLLMPIKGLAEMAHRHNVLLSVDGAHALGMLDLDLHDMGCDHFTTAGQKWLLAGSGTGMAYFSNEIQDRVWSDVAWPFPLQGARKYESSGQRHLPSALGMGDALDFQLAIGKTNIQTRVRQLAKRLKDGLRDLPAVGLGTSGSAEMSGGLTTFYIDGVPKANIQQALMDREEIYLPGSGLNDFACRVSTHFYNTADEVDRVIQVIQHIVENRADYARVG